MTRDFCFFCPGDLRKRNTEWEGYLVDFSNKKLKGKHRNPIEYRVNPSGDSVGVFLTSVLP